MHSDSTSSRIRTTISRIIPSIYRWFRPVRVSERGGMGAVPFDGGTTFRVWAPHASSVYVSGSFNDWSRWRHPLASEGNGYWSADVLGVGPGDEYKYLIRNGRKMLTRSDPYSRELSAVYRNSVVRDPYPIQESVMPEWMPLWNQMVIYELHVGTFGVSAEGKPPANFDDTIAKLPYLKALGINAIELMPIAEFPGELSWGYNPSHPFAVSHIYGGADALRRLVHEAHALGIAVVVDVVYNHFGPDDLSMWQFDGWSENGKGGIYFYNDWRSTTPWADTRPDYGRAEVRQFLRDTALFWLEELELDGLRWDATAYIRNVHGYDQDEASDIAEGWNMMRWVNDEIDVRYPWKIIIAEDLRSNAWITKSTSDGGAGFDAQWDDRFVHPIRDAIIVAEDGQRNISAVADAIQFRYNTDAFERIIYTESHDEVANGKARVPEEIAPGKADSHFARKRAALGAGLMFTTAGIPMLFQGQEFVEDGWFQDAEPLDWQKAERFAGMVQLYRDLIRHRRNQDGHTRGLTGQHVEVVLADNDRKLIAYRRWESGGPGDEVLVVANFANRNATVTVPVSAEGRWHLRFNGDSTIYDAENDNTDSAEFDATPGEDGGLFGTVVLGPYALVIYSQSAEE